MRSSNRTILVALVALSTGCVFTPLAAQGDLDRTLPIETASPPLDVASENGSLAVYVDARRTDVQIVASMSCSGRTAQEAQERLAGARVQAGRDAGGTLLVRAACEGPRYPNDGASITVRLPESGNVRLETSNGRVIAHGLSADLFARTSNGRVEVKGGAGAVDVRSSNGNIDLDGVRGPVRARGSNGRIDLRLAPDADEPFDLSSSNGAVDVRVGSAFTGRVEMATSNGHLHVDAADRLAGSELGRTSGWVQIGRGGGTSKIDTSNGSVSLTVSP